MADPRDPGAFGAYTNEDVTDWGQENIEANERDRQDRFARLPMVTPGPWEIDDDDQRIDGIGTVHMYRVVDPRGDVVVEFSNSGCSEIVYEGDGEDGGKHYDYQVMANAKVIAASPEMYAALEHLMWQIESGKDAFVLTHAKAALAKARGDSI